MEEIVCVGETAIRLSEVVCLKHISHDKTVRIWFKGMTEPVNAYGCKKEEFAQLVSTWKECLDRSDNLKKIT